jgi:hypothetical protein
MFLQRISMTEEGWTRAPKAPHILRRVTRFFRVKYIELDDPHKDDLAILLNNKGNIFWLVV